MNYYFISMGREQSKIRVGVTTGDMNGIGPETIVQVFSDSRMMEDCDVIVYGSSEIFKNIKPIAGEFKYGKVKSAEEAKPKIVNLCPPWDEKVTRQPGVASREAGKYALKSLQAAVNDLASNKIDVLITCPIDKDTIQSDEFDFPGHTEYLAQMSNVEDHLMLLVSGDLRIGVATGHLPLKEVSEQLTKERIIGKVELLRESLIRDFGIPEPRIAVLGLNPHAGDNGLLGSEEKEIINPVVRGFFEDGKLVFGPYGADGFFGSALYKKFDGVLAMYHDQGLAPFKALAFDTGVNFTAGLPIVRTSPDHGTAYDIVGTDAVDGGSLRHAVYVAIDVYKQRRAHKELLSNPLELTSKDDQKE